jgi:exo-beta-1,3-glucanase (GH17 family)
MERYKQLNAKFEPAICYSGYRKSQSPDNGVYPTYEQIKEDLKILEGRWKYLRLYDTGPHPQMVLETIQTENFDFRVMLGSYIEAEVNNCNCPWGGVYSEDELENNKKRNREELNRLIELANKYTDIISFVSVGNEATVDWTDHLVPVNKVIEYVNLIKKETMQPVTFCENYEPWLSKLEPLAKVLDFISIHTYPVWEYKKIHEAIEYTKRNFFDVANKYPGIPVMITEAGWPTNSNGRGIDPENVGEEFQKIYYNDLIEWSKKEDIISFVFEAFDEPWKGSPDEFEPEKHWGLFKENRTPKKVMEEYNS